MDEPPNLECHDLHPPPDRFREDVLRGLLRHPKSTRPRYFYDDEGTRLFERICELPEYYLTRTETALMEREGAAMAELLGPRCLLIEFGSGNSQKVRILLQALPEPVGYMAVDVARSQLFDCCRDLARDYPRLRVIALCADYNDPAAPLRLPDLAHLPPARRVVFFPGSTVGNLTPARCRDFLQRCARLVGPGGGMLIGVDLKKERALLEAAYDDAAGVTARFNLNILARINRELHADFDLAAFRHRAVYDAGEGRIEMHLVSLRAQTVHVAGTAVAFEEGETIHTENSYKYSIDEFQRLASGSGFRPARVFTDPQRLFSVHWLVVP